MGTYSDPVSPTLHMLAALHRLVKKVVGAACPRILEQVHRAEIVSRRRKRPGGRTVAVPAERAVASLSCERAAFHSTLVTASAGRNIPWAECPRVERAPVRVVRHTATAARVRVTMLRRSVSAPARSQAERGRRGHGVWLPQEPLELCREPLGSLQSSVCCDPVERIDRDEDPSRLGVTRPIRLCRQTQRRVRTSWSWAYTISPGSGISGSPSPRGGSDPRPRSAGR